MIKALFKKVSGNLVSFNIEGHAEFDEYNRDIVCSAVSAISYTIVNGITEVVNVSAECHVKDGYANLSIEDQSEEDIEKCQVLMKTMLLGLISMEENYGDYIKVKVKEV
jgi:uncharacterized protein YsxB (DUF464 family)